MSFMFGYAPASSLIITPGQPNTQWTLRVVAQVHHWSLLVIPLSQEPTPEPTEIPLKEEDLARMAGRHRHELGQLEYRQEQERASMKTGQAQENQLDENP